MILTECSNTSVVLHLSAEVDSLCIMSANSLLGATPRADTSNKIRITSGRIRWLRPFVLVMVMAREFAKSFYSSKAWQDCRDGYKAYRNHLCENCLARGLYVPGEIVHHIVELTPDNITDPSVSLNWDNLRLVCRDCHAEEHRRDCRRYFFGKNGEVILRDAPPCRAEMGVQT